MRGPIGPSLSERPVAQKVMKLKECGKIRYSTEIISALKLLQVFNQKRSFVYEIHGYLGQTQNLGARI
jgi:hypothetical protein